MRRWNASWQSTVVCGHSNSGQCRWLFAEGHGSLTIAASELLGSLVSVLLFVPSTPAAFGRTEVSGTTDKQGNSYIVRKLLTTKFPGAAVLMQLASVLSARCLWLDLERADRTLNTEADALTNGDYSLFDPLRRIHIKWEGVMEDHFSLLSQLVALIPLFLEDHSALWETKEEGCASC